MSLIESHEQLIQQLREQLADRESQSNVNQKLSEEAISRLTCEKEGKDYIVYDETCTVQIYTLGVF